jgi:glycosyltransferase involved in cell wall biosynthesis
LAQAIQSVLKQGEKPLEIIVVDDGSTDGSVKVATDFGLQVSLHQHKTNKGVGAARNLGVENSKGEFLAFLDADDFWSGGKLKNQLAYLNNNPNIDIVFGMVDQFISPELSGEDKNRLRGELKKMPGYVAGAMLIRKEKFLDVGWFDE